MKKRKEIKHYLIRAKELGIIPNFYMSEAYLQCCQAECFEENDWLWIEADNLILFPPLPLSGQCWEAACPVDKIWAGFYSWVPHIHPQKRAFFDWQYIFNPKHFNDISGGKWVVYRKNIRKWPRKHEKWQYTKDFKDANSIQALIGDWVEMKQESVLDAELLIGYAFFTPNPNIHRKFLYDGQGQLMAINAWDENWKYINYRVCMVKLNEPFLDEFVRYLFYTDPEIQAKNKLVNDGGTLDNPGLERFKNKMNPVEKHAIYSYTKNE